MEQINNMNYVDLGLPSGIKWATCNIGANSPEEYGDYFVWNEIETKEMQTVRNFKTVVRKFLGLSKIDKRKKIRDKAKANWRDNWRLPTNREMEELVDKCTWTWTTQSGVNGYKVIGPNGNSIFLPATGLYFSVSELRYARTSGNYWSSTPNESSYDSAYSLHFIKDLFKEEHYVCQEDLRYKFTVRLVSE